MGHGQATVKKQAGGAGRGWIQGALAAYSTTPVTSAIRASAVAINETLNWRRL